MSQRILVPGATGTVGSELVRLLVAAGSEIRAATRNPERAESLFGPDVDVVEVSSLVTGGAESLFWASACFHSLQ